MLSQVKEIKEKGKGTRGDAAHSSLVLSVEWDMEGEGVEWSIRCDVVSTYNVVGGSKTHVLFGQCQSQQSPVTAATTGIQRN
jgi:hypothetical protein